ncbi:hypothetical protein FE257_000671 [Aspergillus nanangensis]|uniref:DUF6536 domain-containing protein n=1 Tax=Aspergillus nanangensis TaxID=2582783 RepID=A0AAD4GQ66_ASPNN|nr:hypothetical protein FE257_000671 [Aspergillus nanangensis]
MGSRTKPWIWFQSVFTRQRYRSVSRHVADEVALDDINDKREAPPVLSIPLTFLNPKSKRESKLRALRSGNFTQLQEQVSADEIAAEDGTASKRPKRCWIDGVYLCAKASSVILLLHLIFVAIAAGLASRYPNQRGFGSGSVMYEGSCVVTKRWSIGLHLIINILGTAILGASNYCMQTLVAPTREDIDRAHAQHRWLDIGCASLRNLLAVGRRRSVLWAILMLTATPFHLLYNSMIFESIGTNEFGYIVAPSDMKSDNIGNMATPELQKCFIYPNYRIWGNMTWPDFATLIAEEKYDRISTEQCMSHFNETNQRGIKALIALTPDLSVADGGNDAILSVQVLEGVPSSSSTSGSYAVNHFGTNGYAAHDNKIWAGSYSSDDITLAVDGGPVYYTYNMTSVEDCVGEGGTHLACTHATEVMKWVNSNPTITISHVRNYIDAHDMRDIKAESTVSCGTTPSWHEYTVAECLAIPAEQHCRLMYSPPISIVIALATLVKVVIMFIACQVANSQFVPLLTLGDAVASFIASSDPTTAGMCWLSRASVGRGEWKGLTKHHSIVTEAVQDRPVESATPVYKSLPRGRRWMQVPSMKRSTMTIILGLALIAVGAYLLQSAIISDWLEYTPNSTLSTTLLQKWWAQIDSNAYNFVDGSGLDVSALSAVVIANVPQLAITICYYFYNSVLTSMVAAAEYSAYGTSRKPLRMTWPVQDSEQLSTYWLSLPYQYSVPMLVMYTVLHWLVSQSIFYVTLIPYRPDGQVDWGSDRLLNPTAEPSGFTSMDPNSSYGGSGGKTVNSLAYSPLSLFVALLVGAIMILVLVGLSCRKFKSNMPVAGSCSAAISAACHPPHDEDSQKAVLGELMWGESLQAPLCATEHEFEIDKGHCCFTSLETKGPSEKTLYA